MNYNEAYEFCLCLTLYEASYDTYCLTRSCNWRQSSGLLDRNRSHVEQRRAFSLANSFPVQLVSSLLRLLPELLEVA